MLISQRQLLKTKYPKLENLMINPHQNLVEEIPRKSRAIRQRVLAVQAVEEETQPHTHCTHLKG